MSDSAAWGMPLQAAYCESCDWQYLLPQSMPLPQCPHCCRAQLEPLEATPAPPAPELLLPFNLPAEALAHRIEQFAGDIWFAPGDLKPATLQNRLVKLFLPMWLVDSQIEALWQAEAGFNYEAITHRDSFEDGDWRSRQITETRVNWEPRVGQLQREYHNIPAPALEGHFKLMQQLGQFNVSAGQPYQPQAAAAALIRLPNRSSADAWPDAQPPLQAAAAEECRRAARADHLREFRWSSRAARQNWTLLLLPVYATYYLDDDRQPQPILIHGQSGQISGPRRASMKRARKVALIIVAIAAVIFTISMVITLAGFLLPPLILVGGVGLIIAIVVAMLAVAPLVIVWQVNRSQETGVRS